MKKSSFIILIFILGCFNNVDEQYEINYLPEWYFIDLKEDSKILTKDRLQLKFTPDLINRIIKETGNSKIELKIFNLNKQDEYSLCNMSTISEDGKLLESNGMVKISLYSEGNELEISLNDGVELCIPIDDNYRGYSLFEGIKNSTGRISWREQEIIGKDNVIIDTLINPIPNYTIEEVRDSAINLEGFWHNRNVNGEVELIGRYVKLLPENFNWISIGRLLEIEEDDLITLEVKLEKKYRNQIVGMLFYDVSTYIEMNEIKDNIYSFKVPKQYDGFIISLSNDGTNYYVGESDFSEEKSIITLNPEKMNEGVKKKYMRKLK